MLVSFLAIGGVFSAFTILVVRYMRQPSRIDVAISALKFLPHLPTATKNRVRWQFSAPFLSKLFWLRFLILGLLLFALFLDGESFETPVPTSLGLRIVMDKTASMGVGTPKRIDQAAALLALLEARVAELNGCIEIRQVPAPLGNLQRLGLLSQNGGNISRLIAEVGQPIDDNSKCGVTHVAVISDLNRQDVGLLPPPVGLATDVFWFQMGTPHPNTAISRAFMSNSNSTSNGAVLNVEISEFGEIEGDVSLFLIGPDGQPISLRQSVDWNIRGSKIASFIVTDPGRYVAELRETKGLSADNRLEIEILSTDQRPIALAPNYVDTQLGMLVRKLGPVVGQDFEDAITIAKYEESSDITKPGIYMFPSNPASSEVLLGYFDSHSPLLDQVDLDLWEKAARIGISSVPPGFKIVASDSNSDNVLLAERSSTSRAVLMPEPNGGVNVDILSQPHSTWVVMFLNAWRAISHDRDDSFSTRYIDEQGRPLRNIEYEFNTAKKTGESSSIDDIQPVGAVSTKDNAWWPLILIAVIVLIALERSLGLNPRWSK
ncbi:MAG: hypothetical protein ABJO86_13180 [Lentilitoribacter sp.]